MQGYICNVSINVCSFEVVPWRKIGQLLLALERLSPNKLDRGP